MEPSPERSCRNRDGILADLPVAIYKKGLTVINLRIVTDHQRTKYESVRYLERDENERSRRREENPRKERGIQSRETPSRLNLIY